MKSSNLLGPVDSSWGPSSLTTRLGGGGRAARAGGNGRVQMTGVLPGAEVVYEVVEDRYSFPGVEVIRVPIVSRGEVWEWSRV